MTTLILREGADRLHVELNRPDVRNAINDDMVDELHAVCTSLEREPRILILTGTSTPERGVFAAGADIRQLLERGRDEALAGINSGLFTRIARLPMPVIAAVDGFAIGGGAELAYAADIRIASTRAVFGNPETAIGILAAAGATWRLAELVGEPLAKEILFTGRRLDAEEALLGADLPPELQDSLLQELDGHILELIKDQNGTLAKSIAKKTHMKV